MRFERGKRLGAYEVEAIVGAGGMGEVYRAHDTKLDRAVAIKVLSADLARDPVALARFEREAKALAALSHPNVLGVHDFGHDGADWYFVTELLEGTTLGERMHQGRLPLTKSLELATCIAQGLAAAHAKGLVHRDLKPENVFVTTDGIVKILDFGVARLTAGETTATATAATPAGTPGMVVGSPAYMSPEQAQGQAVDHRSDIFAFGTMLYELLTGRHPFREASTLLTLQKIIETNPPAVEAAATGIPPQLGWLVAKCLAKSPDERYQATADIVVDLQVVRRQIESGAVTPIATAAQPPRTRRRALALAAGAIVVAIVAGALYGVFRPARRPTVPPSIAIRPLTTSGNVIDAAMSPDGKYVAYVESFDGKLSLWMKQTTTSSVIQLVPPAIVGYWGITFSPDGSSIYYPLKSPELGSGGVLFKVAALGGAPRRLLAGIDSVVTFSPDASQISYLRADHPTAGESSVMIASADGSGARAIATRKVPLAFAPGFFISTAWSRDGSILYAPVQDARKPGATIVALSAADGRELPFDFPADRFLQIGSMRVLSDGALVFAAGERGASWRIGSGGEQLWILRTGARAPEPLTNDLVAYRALSASADGRAIVAVAMSARSSVWELKPDGTDARRITSSGLDALSGLSVAPNGRLVFRSIEGGKADIWSMAPDGSDRRQLTTTALNALPAVSPDGRTIIYVSSRANGLHLWRMDADGGGQKQLETIGVTSSAAFSPDGRWVVFPSLASGTESLWRVSADGGEARQITKVYTTRPAISPDGRIIACLYRKTPESRVELALLPFDGGEPSRRFPANVTAISMLKWAADGRSVLNTACEGRQTLCSQPVDGGRPRVLAHYAEEQIFNFDVAGNGRIFLVRGLLSRDAVMITNFR